jgi:hypothetical protein
MLADRPIYRLDANGSGEGDFCKDSRGFVGRHPGLITGEHLNRMGMAIWLFRYLDIRCHSTGVEAGTSFHGYTHEEAAKAFNRSVRAMKVWMARLVKGGYVTTVLVNRGLVVTITGYAAQTSVEAPPDAG